MTAAKKLNLVIASFTPLLVSVIAYFVLPDLIIVHVGPELGFGPKLMIFIIPIVILLWAFFWLYLDSRREEQSYFNVLAANYLWLAILMWQILYTIHREELMASLICALVGILLMFISFFNNKLRLSRILDEIGFVIILISLLFF